jgi:hypothetical protein
MVIPNGGFDTTLKGRRGRRRSVGVGTNDRHVASIELIPQVGGALRMQLDGHHACACRDERSG